MNRRMLVPLGVITMVGVLAGDQAAVNATAAESRPVEAVTMSLGRVETDSSNASTTYDGYILRWGQEGECVGSASTDPDLHEVFVIDDQDNEHYSGHTAHNVCNTHSGDFESWQPWQDCNSQHEGGCPLLEGSVQPHVHGWYCDH